MKKYDQLIFAALLAAVFCLLSATLGLILPTEINVEGTVDADLPAVQVQQPVTQAPVVQVPVTQAPTEAPTTPDASTEDTAPAPDNSSIPQGTEAILAKYTELMNDAKAQSVGFKKIEWQAIPEEKAQFEGKAFSKILPLASNFFKSEADAKAEPEIKEKGADMEWFPIYHNEKGCMLTDVSAIENATCTELPDGNVKIVIELKDEENSEPPVDAPT